MLLSTLIGIFLFIPVMVSEHWCSEFWAGESKYGLCSYTFQLFAFFYVNFLWLGPKLKTLTTGLYAQYATVIISYCVVHNHVLVLPYLFSLIEFFNSNCSTCFKWRNCTGYWFLTLLTSSHVFCAIGHIFPDVAFKCRHTKCVIVFARSLLPKVEGQGQGRGMRTN